MKLICCLTALFSSFASSVSWEDVISVNISRNSSSGQLARQKLTPKVVGGSNVTAYTYPWFSAFYAQDAWVWGEDTPTVDTFYCGGQLVSNYFVLTAAHCKPQIGHLVIVGALCPYEDRNCFQPDAYYRVMKVFEDPRFKQEITYTLGYDFLLVQLNRDVDQITPVKMDDGSYAPNYPSGKSLWAIGLGLVNVEAQKVATQLQHIELSYIPRNECREEVKPANLGEFTICADDDAGIGDACNGDSGGPLYDRENQVLVGLTSYGDPDCVSESPGVYARIADNWSWIQSIICANNPGTEPDLCSDSPEPFTDSPTTEWCSDGADVDVLVATDNWPNETIWGVTELNTGALLAAGSLDRFETDGSHEGNFCLPLDADQCYSFFVYDQGNDGIDFDGGDPDYCVSVNGQELKCEINFVGSMETVVFPADSCNKSCKPEAYRIKGKIPANSMSSTAFAVQDLEGNLYSINQYTLEGIAPDSEFDFHLDLCADCYQLVIQNKDDAMFSLFDGAGNTVFTQEDFSTGPFFSIDSKKFCVDDGGSDSGAAIFSKGASLLLTTAILVANLML